MLHVAQAMTNRFPHDAPDLPVAGCIPPSTQSFSHQECNRLFWNTNQSATTSQDFHPLPIEFGLKYSNSNMLSKLAIQVERLIVSYAPTPPNKNCLKD
ncbi:unnamed protein product [Prunus armeniaca]